MWSELELGRRVTAAELLELAEHDDRARELRDRLLDEIALWVTNVAIVVDPSHIVIGGGMVRSGAAVCRRIEETVAKAAPFPIEVRTAHFGAESALLGAGAVASSGELHVDTGLRERPDDLVRGARVREQQVDGPQIADLGELDLT
jgi:predicted NBD/HSP70 family sugar kinase